MATLIPPQPDFDGSTAEETVWNALGEQLPEEVTLVRGQRLTGDEKDVEIDILVFWPGAGIVVVEVKGERVGVEDGKWMTQDAQGHRNRLKVAPLEQAMVAKHTLVGYLRSRVSAAPGPISHFAVLPYTQLPDDWDQRDAPRRQLVDSTQLDSIAGLISSQLRFDFGPERDDLSTPPEYVLRNLRRTNQAVENVRITAQWLEEDRPAFVGLFHDLPISWGAAPGSDDDSTRSSSMRARTSASCGGKRSSPACATRWTARSTSSPMRDSGSSVARAHHRSR